MKDLTTMPNIGKEMASKLKSVEISTAEDLVEIGAKEAFFRLKSKYVWCIFMRWREQFKT